MAYSADAWGNFFVAVMGASAVLTGLVFVALSINLRPILDNPGLPARAIEAICALFEVLVFSLFALMPADSVTVLGWAILTTGVVFWAAILTVQVHAIRAGARNYAWAHVAGKQLATLPVIVGGASILLGSGGGLYWIVAATVLLLLVGIIDAWVLLVEILR